MFRKFARSFGETPGVGMVGGRWERIGNPWLCKYNELYEELNYPLRGENRGEYWLGGDEVLRVNGCEVLAIPKSVFDRVGPYDEKFQWGGEDSELRGRILQAGYKLKYDLRLSAKHKMRGTLHAFARREFRLGEAAAQWNRRFPSKMSLKHKAGLAILVPFALALVYSILAALAGLPFLAEAAGAALFIPAAVLVFFALDALRYAAFPLAGATPADRASFFFLRMVQSWATYLGLAKKTFLG
jgi:GT2 family glycosyltransferase